VHPFKNGDVVFTGPNLPHVWRSDQEYFEHGGNRVTEGIVIYFPEHFLSESFMRTTESFRIRQLFAHAQRGMAFFGKIAEHVEQQMHALLASKDFDRVLVLLQLLNTLAATGEYALLSSPEYTNTQKDADTRRMNDVHAYVMANFRDRITLREAAAIASMTPTSFSRYFKVHANKTFSDFVSEIRIGHACKLLSTKKISVAQASDESGFHTLSNFNRQFRTVTGYSPLDYRRKYAEAAAY
jgi:AraC-like DNA-binding protein